MQIQVFFERTHFNMLGNKVTMSLLPPTEAVSTASKDATAKYTPVIAKPHKAKPVHFNVHEGVGLFAGV